MPRRVPGADGVHECFEVPLIADIDAPWETLDGMSYNFSLVADKVESGRLGYDW